VVVEILHIVIIIVIGRGARQVRHEVLAHVPRIASRMISTFTFISFLPNVCPFCSGKRVTIPIATRILTPFEESSLLGGRLTLSGLTGLTLLR
jgi:hypothetical protein